MSEHCGYVVCIKELRPHPNADKLQIATFFGNDTCISLEAKIGDIGIYFPSDLQLSEEFCDYNHLCRTKADGTPDTGYLERDKRNVKASRLRGEKSDGIYMPLKCLDYIEADVLSFQIGDKIEVVNGHEICCKYIPRRNHRQGGYSEGNRTRKKKVDIAPLFAEHADTEQLAYNLGAFKPGDEIEITLKMHGTSQRTGYLPVFNHCNDTIPCRVGNAMKQVMNKLLGKEVYVETHDGKPVYEWGYVSGTRRTVLEDYDGGYYGSNEFREQHSKTFEGKLWKGETVYYEVVGFTHTGAPIMAEGNNEKLGKDFVKQYGKTTTFSYGCEPEGSTLWQPDGEGDYDLVGRIKQSDIYVYRMTMTNEDGAVVEYTPDFMRYRCEQMGVKTVPVLWKGYIEDKIQYIPSDDDEFIEFNAGEWVKKMAERYYDGPDPIGKTHIREGVVVRILNRPKFCAYKHKNFSFKVIENIIKDVATEPDMEEEQEVIE